MRRHRLACRELVAHDADMLRRRADKSNAMLGDDFGEMGVFRQESVAWMNRVGTGDLGRRHDRRNIEIARFRRWRADAYGFVGQADMHGLGVGGRVDRDRTDTHFAARPMNAHRDLATVGDENLVEHRRVR